MDAKRLADKYITRTGKKPRKPRAPRRPRNVRCDGQTITIPVEDYRRLLQSAECDDMIGWCDHCQAWIDRNDPAYIATSDFTACEHYLCDRGECRKYRSIK